ncbi:MAG TPA: TIGR01777 family oxidoreductase [Candidatus Acidoferrum sp.]|nr:TIGR01777 family oxidoreductase [Candidatus Acidoferrum sp.]
MNAKTIVIAGGSGFIGNALAKAFLATDRPVIVLTRTPRSRTDGVLELRWDGEKTGEWVKSLEGAAAIINLAGHNINCRHTPENLREIAASRLNSVKAIAAGMTQLKTPPRVWVQASATGFYGDTGDRLCDETGPNGSDTLAQVCRDWEKACERACESMTVPGMRRVILRIGFVMGRDGGALPVLARLTKLFLGGAVGNGRQYISWIHLADVVGIFAAAVANEAMAGTYNTVAPNPVTNAEFMRELRRALRRPWSPPAPALAVKLGARLMGTEGSLALVSQRCSAQKITVTGFQFQFPELAPALRDLCGKI